MKSLNEELARELKAAGFPQKHFAQFVDCADPTLAELIEACGKDFLRLVRITSSGYRADGGEYGEQFCAYQQHGSTPEEAVARLWLALNKRVMSLQKRLAKYLMARPGVKIPKGLLCDLARSCEEKYTGENTGRRLRYLKTCYDVKGTSLEEPEHTQARKSCLQVAGSTSSMEKSTPRSIGLSPRSAN